jgi:hypothetical protein
MAAKTKKYILSFANGERSVINSPNLLQAAKGGHKIASGHKTFLVTVIESIV